MSRYPSVLLIAIILLSMPASDPSIGMLVNDMLGGTPPKRLVNTRPHYLVRFDRAPTMDDLAQLSLRGGGESSAEWAGADWRRPRTPEEFTQRGNGRDLS